MAMLTVHAYDHATGAYLGETVAFPDPLTPSAYLIPASATEAPPPVAGTRHVAKWSNNAWSLVADYRGWRGYRADGTAVEITAIGVSPDDSWSTTPPAPNLTQIQMARGVTTKASCAEAIVGGFTSSALGSARTYASQATDQANINAASANGGSIWCADSGGSWSLAAHTASQAQQVRNDLWAHIQACQTKYADLLAQISAAATVAAVRAINW